MKKFLSEEDISELTQFIYKDTLESGSNTDSEEKTSQYIETDIDISLSESKILGEVEI